jgi:acyl carrier protein
VSVRADIIEILRICRIFTLSGEPIDESLLTDHDDVPLSLITIDSLEAMQLCIELEKRCGWSITPEELIAFESLGELARALEAHVGRQ